MILMVVLALYFLRDALKNRSAKAADRRLRRVERKLDLILDHLNIQPPEETCPEAIKDLVRSGMKIRAIKAFRQQTGASLAEACDAIDAIEKQLRT
jgi:hypothetical protein